MPLTKAEQTCWDLVKVLRDLELQYAVEHSHYPQGVVVFAGAALVQALRRADGQYMWRFDSIAGLLVVRAVRAVVNVVPAPAPEFPAWDFRVVLGAVATGTVPAPVAG